MVFRTRHAFALIGLLSLAGVAFAVDKTETLDKSESPIELETLNVEALAEGPAKGLETLHVRLQNDGRLDGRLKLQHTTGKAEAANAKVAFTQNGDLVSATSTDADGNFQLTEMKPGQYMATAAIDSGTTNFNVEVLAFDPQAAPEEMVLEGTLTPIPEAGMPGEIVVDGGIVDGGYCDVCGGQFVTEGVEMVGDPCTCGEEIVTETIIEEEIVDEGCCAPMGNACCGGGFSGGGCCGGGGGVGGRGLGLLGIGGLAAGITALALNKDKPIVVSPYHIH